MDSLIQQFKNGYRNRNGYEVAAVFTPIAPPEDPSRLYAFHRSTNAVAIVSDLRAALLYHNDLNLSQQEATVWIDTLSFYWAAIGDLLVAEDTGSSQGKARDVDWSNIYESWKKLSDSIIRGFQNSLFPYWGVPLLASAGKYLRNLAIKADESARQRTGDVIYNEGLQDDIVSSVGKNENLTDAARQINRMFSACLADRCVEPLSSTPVGPADKLIGQQLMNRGNGACMRLQIYFLRPILE
jgi:COP9 signalosome complex subunit 12